MGGGALATHRDGAVHLLCGVDKLLRLGSGGTLAAAAAYHLSVHLLRRARRSHRPRFRSGGKDAPAANPCDIPPG